MFADGNESDYTSTIEWSEPCRRFELHEVVSATDNFNKSLVIGSGGFGKVYKGNFVNGSTTFSAAIKRFDSLSGQGVDEFRAEVKTLSRARHTHLVSLMGYCEQEEEMILVYEYIPNGTLHEHLHRLRTHLSWLQRLKIGLGVAVGLDYLHTGTSTEFGIIHGDFKSYNILLNKNWAAKISDFGMSKVVPRDTMYVETLVKGTNGYLDPHFFLTGRLSTKSDVYSFGIVLLEMLCRKRTTDRTLDEQQSSLPRWALGLIKKSRLKQIIDLDIRDEISPKCLSRFVKIAARCLDHNPEDRPTMAEVVSTLEYVLNLQQKTNNVLQAAGKTRFGRNFDTFSITGDDKTSGTEFGFRMPKKRKLLMLRGKILQQSGALSFKGLLIKILQLKTKSFGSIKVYRAKELEKATNNYAQDRILGRGGHGVVYKGVLQDKRVVAIKRHKILGQSQLEQIITEIVILEKSNHKNVVKLLGCCFDTEGALLIYEFVSNRTLHHHIHNESATVRLSWDSRLRIAQESADALAYLHTYSTMSIIHRDVKCANILLDENYTAKVSDFGSSRLIRLNRSQVATDIEGTIGYLDPEYIRTRQPTPKTDVYGFGVVLAELLTGKKPIDRKRDEDDINLSAYFVKETKENRLHEIVDPQVLEETTGEQLSTACDLVYRCLKPLGENRPSMKEVTMDLETIRKLGKNP